MSDGGYVVPAYMRDRLRYADATVIGSPVTVRIASKFEPVPCPGCEGHSFVAWFTHPAWPTPHELPIDRARFCEDDGLHCGKARTCRHCHGSGLWGGDVQQQIADYMARLVDKSVQAALLQGFSNRDALRQGVP